MALTITPEMMQAISIDAVEQFGTRFNKLAEVLGVTSKQPMREGSFIKTFKSEVSLASTDVAPGALIPLSTVTRELADVYELGYHKARAATPLEDVQSMGVSAITRTDEKLMRAVQKEVRSGMFTALKTGTGVETAETFQKIIAKNTAAVRVAFDDDDPSVISFVNPYDAYEYLGDAQITTQSVFGLNYLSDFMDNAVIFMSADVPRGTVYTTAAENMKLYYADVTEGATGDYFGLTSASDGIIGFKHSQNDPHMAIDTIIVAGILWLPERLDGIVVGSIVPPKP